MALTQILTTDSVSSSVVNTKIVDPANTALTGLQIAQTAGGTSTAITLTGVELTNGYQKTFVINASNSGAATTINGKPLYKPGGTVAPNLIAGKAASIWYNLAGDCFFYKASAEGNAVVGDVLAGKTFSNDDDTGLAGTMTNQGAVTITPGTTNQTIAAGYHNGSGVVAGDADLIGANIIPGINIFGVNGNAPVKKYATGSGTSDPSSNISISGLTFTPACVVVHETNSGFYRTQTYWSGITYTNKAGYFQTTTGGYVATMSVFSGGFSLSLIPSSNFVWIAFE